VSQVDEPGDEQADVLLDPNFDPGGGAMGTMGADGSVETNWFSLLHRRVTDRAVRSPRYQWWALVALLAGLLSLNITFTVFVVALPQVAKELHSTVTTLTSPRTDCLRCAAAVANSTAWPATRALTVIFAARTNASSVETYGSSAR